MRSEGDRIVPKFFVRTQSGVFWHEDLVKAFPNLQALVSCQELSRIRRLDLSMDGHDQDYLTVRANVRHGPEAIPHCRSEISPRIQVLRKYWLCLIYRTSHPVSWRASRVLHGQVWPACAANFLLGESRRVCIKDSQVFFILKRVASDIGEVLIRPFVARDTEHF